MITDHSDGEREETHQHNSFQLAARDRLNTLPTNRGKHWLEQEIDQ